jgi:hypothetical protein
MNGHRSVSWLLVIAGVGCAIAYVRGEARRIARERDEKRQLQDWESEGGALATQPQVPGADVGPGG